MDLMSEIMLTNYNQTKSYWTTT